MTYRVVFKDSEGYSWDQTTTTEDLGRAMADAEHLAIHYSRTAVVQVWEDASGSNGVWSGGWYDYAEKSPSEESEV